MSSSNGTLFNAYELSGLTISTIYFIIGFPTNLLAIIVCCRSLLGRSFLSNLFGNFKCREHRNKFQDSNNFNTTINNQLSIKNENKSVIDFDEINNEKIKLERVNEKPINNLTISNCNSKKASRRLNLNLSEKNKTNQQLSLNKDFDQVVIKKSLINQMHNNEKIKSHAKKKRLNNPHRKCFELYLIEISFCDLIVLGYNFSEWVLLILSRFNMIDSIYAEPVLISKFMCRFIIALNRTIILLHNWLVTSLAFTRCYAIYKPINSTYFSSKFYYRLNLSILLVLILIFGSINFFGVMLLSYTKAGVTTKYSNHSIETRAQCRISNEIYENYKYIDVYINITLGIIGYSLPCCVTLIINLILIYNIRHMQNQAKCNVFKDPSSRLTSVAKNRNTFFKATSSLLMLSFSYIICYLPYSCIFLLLSLDLMSMNGVIIFVLSSLRYLNHSVNFYIYFATGRNFRNDVISLVSFGKKSAD